MCQCCAEEQQRRAMEFQRRLRVSMSLAERAWDRDLLASAKMGDVFTVDSVYLVNPDPNMQRTGDETV